MAHAVHCIIITILAATTFVLFLRLFERIVALSERVIFKLNHIVVLGGRYLVFVHITRLRLLRGGLLRFLLLLKSTIGKWATSRFSHGDDRLENRGQKIGSHLNFSLTIIRRIRIRIRICFLLVFTVISGQISSTFSTLR